MITNNQVIEGLQIVINLYKKNLEELKVKSSAATKVYDDYVRAELRQKMLEDEIYYEKVKLGQIDPDPCRPLKPGGRLFVLKQDPTRDELDKTKSHLISECKKIKDEIDLLEKVIIEFRNNQIL